MATGSSVKPGKTVFVKGFLKNNPDANEARVNEAWTAAGNTDTVSSSLVHKMRARLGLTKGSKTLASQTEAGGKAARKSPSSATPPKTKNPGRTPRAGAGSRPHSPTSSTVTDSPSPSTSHQGDDDLLDDLEEGIDELIQKVRNLGNRPDVVKALRRARRLLYGAQEA